MIDLSETAQENSTAHVSSEGFITTISTIETIISHLILHSTQQI